MPPTAYQDAEDWFVEQGLDLPSQVPAALVDRLRRFGPAWWATQKAPLSLDDYMHDDVSRSLLAGDNPDQFALSHAGHGINSYALNLRLAVGEVALLVQAAWGGAYGDPVADSRVWNELVANVDRFLAAPGLDVKPATTKKSRTRQILVMHSTFRDDGQVHLWVRNASGIWDEVGTVESWAELHAWVAETRNAA